MTNDQNKAVRSVLRMVAAAQRLGVSREQIIQAILGSWNARKKPEHRTKSSNRLPGNPQD
jgi:hypothetical protein